MLTPFESSLGLDRVNDVIDFHRGHREGNSLDRSHLLGLQDVGAVFRPSVNDIGVDNSCLARDLKSVVRIHVLRR